jgi:hypothetical protein
MNKMFIGFLLAVTSVTAYASCSTTSTTYQGVTVVCTTCCANNICNTTCY